MADWINPDDRMREIRKAPTDNEAFLLKWLDRAERAYSVAHDQAMQNGQRSQQMRAERDHWMKRYNVEWEANTKSGIAPAHEPGERCDVQNEPRCQAYPDCYCGKNTPRTNYPLPGE